MEAMEKVVNKETVENIVKEVSTAKTGKGAVIAAGVGVATILGIAGYKFVVKPIAAKVKAKKEQQEIDETCEPDEESND